jgi:hypothetical protein
VNDSLEGGDGVSTPARGNRPAVTSAGKAHKILEYLTFGFLAYYVPIETWASLPELWHPFYVDAAIGIALLAWGLVLLHRPSPSAVGVLCAGYAWMSASGWRSTFGRVFTLREGGYLQYGAAEMCFVICSTGLTIVGLLLSLMLIVRRPHSADTQGG